MEQPPLAYYVYVDFENTQNINLALLQNNPIHLTLLVGEKQKHLPVHLVQHLLKYHTKVNLIEVTTTAKNALDFVLTFHIGKAVALDPNGYFYIVSKDKGYDALIKHLTENNIKAARYDEFDNLPPLQKNNLFNNVSFTQSPLISSLEITLATNSVQKNTTQAISVTEAVNIISERLRKYSSNRPSRYESLIAYINSYLRNTTPTLEGKTVVEQFIKQNLIKLDANKKVLYSL